MAFGSHSAFKFLFEGENPIGPVVVVGAILFGLGLLLVQRLAARADRGRANKAARATQEQIKHLRRERKLKGPFTFADAVELTTTGTITPKPLAKKIRDSAPVLRWLYEDEEHGPLYQYEMGGVSIRNLEEALEASQTLELQSVVRTLQETKAAFDEFDRVNARNRETGTPMQDDWYCAIGDQIKEIAGRHRSEDGTKRYAEAAKLYLAKHAPNLLPLD